MAVMDFFFSGAPTAQNSPELHFRFMNSFIQPSLVRSLRLTNFIRFLNERVAEGDAFDPHDFKVGARVKSTLNEAWRKPENIWVISPIYFWHGNIFKSSRNKPVLWAYSVTQPSFDWSKAKSPLFPYVPSGLKVTL